MNKILIVISILLVSCQKDMMLPSELERGVQPNYSTIELLELLGMYGTNIPDVVPAFNNYYQDITGGASNLGQLSLVNGELFVTNVGDLVTDTVGYTFDWYINDVLQCTEVNPKLWDLDDNLVCDGVVRMRLDITTPQNAKYSRTEWAYIDYNYIDNCECEDCPNLFEVFYTFYPDVQPYYYQVECAEYDFDCNQTINASDLLTFLSLF